MFPLMMSIYGVGPTAALALAAGGRRGDARARRRRRLAGRAARALGAATLKVFASQALRILFFAAPGLVALAEVSDERPATGSSSTRSAACSSRSGTCSSTATRPEFWQLAYPAGVGARADARLHPALPARAAAFREAGDVRCERAVQAEGVGIQYLFDRQQRTVSPTIARLPARRRRELGAADVSFEIGAGRGRGAARRERIGQVDAAADDRRRARARHGRIDHARADRLAAFDPGRRDGALTGRENTLLLGVLAGMTPAQARAEMDDGQAAQRPRGALRAPRRQATPRGCARGSASP